MINRRFLRVKVLQALYAYLGSGEEHVEEGVKQNVRNWQPDYIPQLFKFTQLQDTCAMNMLALVNNEPKTLNLKQILLG